MAYTFREGDLPKLDLQVDRATDFKAWKSQWDACLSLSGLDSQAPAKQVQALPLAGNGDYCRQPWPRRRAAVLAR